MERFRHLKLRFVTTQAREGIETFGNCKTPGYGQVTTQAREGIET